MKKLFSIVFIFVILLVLNGCADLSLADEVEYGYEDQKIKYSDGIIIYSGRVILSGNTEDTAVEIVAKRLQQLRAATPNGGVVYWESSDIPTMEVDKYTGYLQVGQSLGRKAIITAYLRDKPEVKAQVHFVVRDLR